MRYLFFLLLFWFPARAQRPVVAVRWSFAGNNYGSSPKSGAVLTVRRKDGARMPATGWKIYFNSNRAVDTATEEGELQIRHINGDLFCMEPVGLVGPVEPVGSGGRELRVRYVCADLSMNISDAPNGFFWVWDNVPDRGYPISDFVVGRIDDEKIRPVTAAVEYERNLRIKDIPSERLPLVFPTPVACRVLPGRLRLDTATVIVAGTGFRREADYLAEALAPVLGHRLRVVALGRGVPGRAMIVLDKKDMDSSAYTVHTGVEGVRIMASSGDGIFCGVQSLLGLFGSGMTLPMVEIRDRPRFAYRGLMIDVARNFRGPRELRRILDLMAFCKLNVLHLHLSDDEGWRLSIPGLPELVSVGGRRGWPASGSSSGRSGGLPPSFGSGPVVGSAPGSGYYSRETFIGLLRYARDRHIRVIPEIECPGHARAAIRAMDMRYASMSHLGSSEAATYLLRDTMDRSVYEGSQLWNDDVVCPALPSVYRFMDKVVTEMQAMYREAGAPLSTIHFGGDEVAAGAWEGSPACRELAGGALAANHDGAELRRYCWNYFYSRLDTLLARHGLALSAWEEAALPGKNFNIYVWDNMIGGGNEDLPYRLANAGHSVVLACVSNNYYDLAYERTFEEPGYHWAGFLDTERPFSFIPYDYYRNSAEDWKGDPVSPGYFNSKEKLSIEGRRNILGIEGLLWAENMVSDQLEEYMLLPKLLGTAERAWVADPAWGTGVDTVGGSSYDSAWNLFVNNCGKRLLPRLSRLGGGYAYRIPAPGVRCRDGRVSANCSLPGFMIRYSTDGSEPTTKSPRYTAPLAYKSGMRLRVFDSRGRGGRSVDVDNK